MVTSFLSLTSPGLVDFTRVPGIGVSVFGCHYPS